MMKPASALLVKTLDASKDQSGETVDAKLAGKVTLTNGTELPKGTMLLGKVTADDMQQQGMSKLALRFDQARLKDGTTVPIRATIVGFLRSASGGVRGRTYALRSPTCRMIGARKPYNWIKRTWSRA